MFRETFFKCLLLVLICLSRLVHGDLTEGDVLNHFLKIGFEEEEYGYVLQGVKPVSIRDFYSLDEIPVYKDFNRFKNAFLKTLLAQSALPIWNKHFNTKGPLVLKGIALKPDKPTVTGFEVQFIHVPKLKEVIAKNIDLFRYVLGPRYTVEDLVELIAFSDKKLVDILQEDSTLIGIVLGFGSYNSILGGRSDAILNAFVSRDIPPLAAKSAPMQSEDKQDSFLPASCYGSYYLDLAGGKESTIFQNTSLPIKTDLNPTQELLALNALEEPLPSCLREKTPEFIFGPYKGGPDNQPVFKQLQSVQKKLQPLLANQNFLHEVTKTIPEQQQKLELCQPLHPNPTKKNQLLKLFGYHRKKIKQPNPLILSDLLSHISLEQWNAILSEVANRFEDQNEKKQFLEAFHSPSDGIPEMIGVSRATLKGLEKARSNLKEANNQFLALSKRAAEDTSLKTIVKDNIYYETTRPGKGKTLNKSKRVRIGYVIKDTSENVLFAHCDTWLSTNEMLPGLVHGIQGMQPEEKRTIYLHPIFGYGALTTLPPCTTLKIEVHLLDFEATTQETLPPLTPFTCSQINDPSFYRSIKSSCEQIPTFTGSQYGKLFSESAPHHANYLKIESYRG